MRYKSKIIMLVGVVAVLAGLTIFQVTNKDLFQGRLTTNPGADQSLATLLPDLKPTLQILPKDDENNLKIGVTIENIGQGTVSNTAQYNYSVYVNDQIVFTNTDFYSEMGPGNKFSFTYPIEKSIYKYPDTGKVKIVIDKDNVIQETDKANNTAEVQYKL